MKNIKVFLWAALHHPEFWTCLIFLPVLPEVRSWVQSDGRYWRIRFPKARIYIPWKIERAYELAHGQATDFDDIPF